TPGKGQGADSTKKPVPNTPVRPRTDPVTTPASEAFPNFAGTWEPIEITVNGKPQSALGRPLTITQMGALVYVDRKELKINRSGAVTYQTFWASDDKVGHVVGTEDQADLVYTVTVRVEGSTLIYDTILQYKAQFGKHPPGTDHRIMKCRRIA